MFISRIFIRNFRTFAILDVRLVNGVTCIVGENNTGKSNLAYAIRLAIDSSLPGNYRVLNENDIHAGVDFSTPQQVIVSLEFSGYSDHDHERALVGAWEVADDKARIMYRFRPSERVREEIEENTREPQGLSLEDYSWELRSGGAIDPVDILWNQDCGNEVRFSYLQAFQVVCLGALRDVEQDLKHSRNSPLGRLLSTSDIPQDEKDEIVRVLREANADIAERDTLRTVGTSIHDAFAATAGEAFPMNIKLGMADISFSAIARSLTVLLSNDAIQDFDPSRNGLGLNNVLYISMLMEYFARRIAAEKAAGELLIVEEPEAHLHPQLQRTLYQVLKTKPFQTIITTHSTYITSAAPLNSLVVLTNTGTGATGVNVPTDDLTEKETADLERYLDSTRSALLFARKVILVEGPAELFLIPSLVKKVMQQDLDRLGISVIPIFGVHFKAYAKLFGDGRIEKKCAIITDGDLRPSDIGESDLDEDEHCEDPDLDALENDFVKVFRCLTTFERALTQKGLLKMLATAAEDCNITSVSNALRRGFAQLNVADLDANRRDAILEPLRDKVLKAAKRVGKARFAQLAATHIDQATTIPAYIREAVEWLIEA